jgi:hypothetical protein
MKSWNKWVKAALIRGARTMSQIAIASIGSATMLREVDWRFVISTTVLSGILSLLMSVTGLPEIDE